MDAPLELQNAQATHKLQKPVIPFVTAQLPPTWDWLTVHEVVTFLYALPNNIHSTLRNTHH